MSEKDNSVYGILGRLDKNRAEELRAKMKEIEFRKDDYMRSWQLQYDNYKMHNQRNGTSLKGIHPTEMPHYLERELQAEAEKLEREQKEEREEKEADQKEHVANDNEKVPARYGFLEQKDEMTRDQDQEDRALRKELGPRRYGFLEQKDEVTKDHDHEDKEMSKERDDHEPEKSIEDIEPDYYEER